MGSRIRIDPADSSGMSVPHWPWKAPSAPATVRCLGSSTRIRARMNWFHVQTDMRIPSDTIAGLARGTWIRQNRSHIPAPSTRAASDSSRGMFTKCARIQNTANGMYRPISGRMIASRVLRTPSDADDVVDRGDDRLERQRQPEDEQQQEQPVPGDPQVPDGEARHRRDEQRDRHDAEHDRHARNQQRAHARLVRRPWRSCPTAGPPASRCRAGSIPMGGGPS